MSKEQLVLRLLQCREHRLAAAAHGLPRRDGLHPARSGDERPRRGADLHRRHAQRQHHGTAHQGAPASGGVRSRPVHRRLPPADAVERPPRATRTAYRKSARSRAASRHSRASSRFRSWLFRSCRARRRCARTRSRACRTLGSPDRSNRTRPGHVPVARKGAWRRRRGSRGRDHQPQPGQAPQRPNRRHEALLQEEADPVRVIRQRRQELRRLLRPADGSSYN